MKKMRVACSANILFKKRTTKALIRLRGAQADLRLWCSHAAKSGFLSARAIYKGRYVGGDEVRDQGPGIRNYL